MTYLDYLNRFHLWLEGNPLPPAVQLMYFKLLHVFNRAGWPESVAIGNRRLMVMLDVYDEKTIIRYRKQLMDAGFIGFQAGKKGSPNRYILRQVDLFTGAGASESASINASVSASENTSTNAGISASESASTNASHIKTKKKNKTKSTFAASRRDAAAPWKGAAVLDHNYPCAGYDIAEVEAMSHLKIPKNL